MELAHTQGAYGAAYLRALVSAPETGSPNQALELTLSDLPSQTEIDRRPASWPSGWTVPPRKK